MSTVRYRLGRVAAAAIFLAAGSARSSAPPIKELVGGTSHQSLFGVVVDGDNAIAVGDSGAILESKSASSWHAVTPPPTALGLLGVALRDGHALAVGQMGAIFRRDKGGIDWKPVDSGTTNRLFAVAMNVHGAALAVGAFGTALRSDDFGATWHTIAPDWDKYTKDGQQPHLYDAAIDDAGVMTLAGEFGLILRSTDGHNWTTLHTGDESIFALGLRADGGGFAVGQNGLVLRTSDSGGTWQPMHSPTTAILLGVRSTPDGHVIATGMHDTLTSHDNGVSWSHLPDARFASSWYQGVADPGGDRPWLVVGHSGELLEISK